MYYDILVIGSGAAGITLALQILAERSDARVAILSKGALTDGSTTRAQGGIAAVLDATDSTDLHIADTLNAGAGLCNPVTVQQVVENARTAIDWLIEQGVDFDRDTAAGKYHLTREGGHSHRRVIHAADATGRAVENTLVERLKETSADIFEDHLAVDLICERTSGDRLGRCVGAYALDRKTGKVETFAARAVVLATGGASRVYLYSTNPDGATGDGIAMAWRAGCRIGNMEFSQFHPTCLYHPEAKSFLITEAVRGEGGKLLRPDGTRFMDDYDSRGELAPRDIVARAIDDVMKRLGCACVYLDISHQDADFIVSHFPNVYAECLKYGIDMTKQPIPVVPAAHYTCGGVLTGAMGQTDVENLYAVGEVACTGLHGANRMASNSLLECLVFATAAARDICGKWSDIPLPPVVAVWDESWVTDSDEEVVVAHNWDELRRFMWDYVGIVRSTKRLQRAQHRIDLLQTEIAEYYSRFRVTHDLLELRNLATVAELIVRSALGRRESRGLHYTLDYPSVDCVSPPQNTILVPDNFAARRKKGDAMTLHRMCLIAVLTGGLLLPAVAGRAADKPEENRGGESSVFQTFIKVPPITAEFWGEDGLYHGLDLSITLQCSISLSLSKKLPELIRVALTARPWEDYTRGNPAKLIKAIVMGEIQKESYGPLVEDVLITHLLVR